MAVQQRAFSPPATIHLGLACFLKLRPVSRKRVMFPESRTSLGTSFLLLYLTFVTTFVYYRIYPYITTLLLMSDGFHVKMYFRQQYSVVISVTHYMLCMIGSAVFIIHSIALAFFYKHNLELCKSKKSMQVTPADTREGKVYHQGNSTGNWKVWKGRKYTEKMWKSALSQMLSYCHSRYCIVCCLFSTESCWL